MRKLFALMLTAVAFIIVGCSGGGEALNALPDNVDFVACFNVNQIEENSGIPIADMVQQQSAKDINDLGIDLSQGVYVFARAKDELVGVIAAVKDADKLQETLRDCTKDGDVYVAENGELVFNNSLLVGIANCKRGTDKTELAKSLLAQKSVPEGSKLIAEQLNDIDAPVTAAVDMGIMKTLASMEPELAAALALSPINYDEVVILGSMDCTESSVWMDVQTKGKNSKADKQIKEWAKKAPVIEGGKITGVADDCAGVLTLPLHGNEIWDCIPAMATNMLKAQTNEEVFNYVQQFVKAFDGIATFTVAHVKSQYQMPAMSFCAKINDPECMDGLMSLAQTMTAYSDEVNIMDCGSHNYLVNAEGQTVQLGTKGNELLVNYGCGPDGLRGDKTIELEKGTSMYMEVNFDNIDMIAGFGLDQFTMWSKDDASAHAKLTITQTWRQLVGVLAAFM